MVAWDAACRPTELGGLGIIDLKLAGYALQTRWLWLQKTDSSRAWSELPISTDPQVRAFFRASTYTVIGDGTSTLLWEERWLQETSPAEMAPNLMLLIPKRSRSKLTVRQGLDNLRWTRGIPGNLNTAELAEFLDLWEATANIILNDQPDRTVRRWTPDANYSAKSAYSMLHSSAVRFARHSLIWKTWAPLKVKIFLWLAFKKRQ